MISVDLGIAADVTQQVVYRPEQTLLHLVAMYEMPEDTKLCIEKCGRAK